MCKAKQIALWHSKKPTATDMQPHGDERHAGYRHIRAERSSEPSIMIRSRDRPSRLWWCSMSSMCLTSIIPLPTMSDQLAIAFLLGALDLRQTSRSKISIEGVCRRPIIAIPAACGASRRANLFFPLAREVKEMRGASTHAYTAHRKDRVASSCRASPHYHNRLA